MSETKNNNRLRSYFNLVKQTKEKILLLQFGSDEMQKYRTLNNRLSQCEDFINKIIEKNNEINNLLKRQQELCLKCEHNCKLFDKFKENKDRRKKIKSEIQQKEQELLKIEEQLEGYRYYGYNQGYYNIRQQKEYQQKKLEESIRNLREQEEKLELKRNEIINQIRNDTSLSGSPYDTSLSGLPSDDDVIKKLKVDITNYYDLIDNVDKEIANYQRDDKHTHENEQIETPKLGKIVVDTTNDIWVLYNQLSSNNRKNIEIDKILPTFKNVETKALKGIDTIINEGYADEKLVKTIKNSDLQIKILSTKDEREKLCYRIIGRLELMQQTYTEYVKAKKGDKDKFIKQCVEALELIKQIKNYECGYDDIEKAWTKIEKIEKTYMDTMRRVNQAEKLKQQKGNNTSSTKIIKTKPTIGDIFKEYNESIETINKLKQEMDELINKNQALGQVLTEGKKMLDSKQEEIYDLEKKNQMDTETYQAQLDTYRSAIKKYDARKQYLEQTINNLEKSLNNVCEINNNLRQSNEKQNNKIVESKSNKKSLQAALAMSPFAIAATVISVLGFTGIIPDFFVASGIFAGIAVLLFVGIVVGLIIADENKTSPAKQNKTMGQNKNIKKQNNITQNQNLSNNQQTQNTNNTRTNYPVNHQYQYTNKNLNSNININKNDYINNEKQYTDNAKQNDNNDDENNDLQQNIKTFSRLNTIKTVTEDDDNKDDNIQYNDNEPYSVNNLENKTDLNDYKNDPSVETTPN